MRIIPKHERIPPTNIKVLRIKELGLKMKNSSSTFILWASSVVKTVGKGCIMCSNILLFPIHIFVAININKKSNPIDIKNVIPDANIINNLPINTQKSNIFEWGKVP